MPHLASLMLAHVSDAILVTDEQDLVRYWGPGAERLFGVSAAEAVGQRVTLFYRIDWDQPEGHKEAVRALTEGQFWQGENPIVLRSGEQRRVESKVAVMRDDQGGMLGYLSVVRDVTERWRQVEALREADLRKSEFLATLSHELRNPLAPIRNSLRIVAQTPPPGAAAQQALAVIERQVAHLCRLVDDLLDLTRISRGQLQLLCQPVDWKELVCRTVDDHRSLFEQSVVRLVVDLDAQPLWVHGDPTRLAQVVGNLLHNAAKFTGSGGTIALKLAAEKDSGMIQLSVHDTGMGIPATLLPRLFQPFVQAQAGIERSHGGLGLGLNFVRRIVELHGGNVTASSPGSGQGALFVVRLPAGSSGAAQGGAEPLPPKATEQARRVLIIDDNVDAATSLGDLLELSGHTVSLAANGPDGIALAKRTALDIVICDIGLPILDGYAVARAIRSDPALARVRLVALSGYALKADIARARAAGFDAHLAKPAPLAELDKQLSLAPHDEGLSAAKGGAPSR